MTAVSHQALESYLWGAATSTMRNPPNSMRNWARMWTSRSFPRHTASGITYLVRKYATAAGLSEVSPHTLRQCVASRSVARDTFAAQLMDASGHDLRLVQHLLGHSRIETTARYLRPSAEAALEALERLSVGLGEE